MSIIEFMVQLIIALVCIVLIAKLYDKLPSGVKKCIKKGWKQLRKKAHL